MAIKSYKELSRMMDLGKEYCGSNSQNPTIQEYQCGLLQRITEAIEKMAQGPTVIEAERRATRYQEDAVPRWGTICQLKTEIRKLKRELKARDKAGASKRRLP